MRIGRFEVDRIDRDLWGQLYLVEVRSRRTSALALRSVGRVKQRRLAVMARNLSNLTGEVVAVEVEALGKDGIVRKVLGVVQPEKSDHNL